MDTLAHGLWAYIIGRGTRRPERWWILGLVSAGPDFVWLPFTALSFFTNGKISFFTLPYALSHSLVLWVLITLLLSLRWKNIWKWSWPWALHILLDIPGHIGIQNQTPFLWPISHFTIRGAFDWLTPTMLFINYCILICTSALLYIRDHKKEKNISK
jgi:hypothetical protein